MFSERKKGQAVVMMTPSDGQSTPTSHNWPAGQLLTLGNGLYYL